jgi:hypothetical protein
MLYTYQLISRGTQQPIDWGRFDAPDFSTACVRAQTVPFSDGEACDVRLTDASGEVWTGRHLRSR